MPNGTKIAERARVVLDGTVPVCEYTGLIVGLRLASDLGATEVEVFMDAELIVYQVTGHYQCKKIDMQVYLQQVMALRELFDVADVRLFPKSGPNNKRRYLNEAADALAAECKNLGKNIDRRF